MCNPLALQAGSTAFSVMGQADSANASNAREEQQARAQAVQLRYGAAVSRSDALTQASLIRKQTKRDIGTANTAVAASGVVVGEGSSGEVNNQIYQDSEHDAFTAILSGERKARNMELQADYGIANAEASKKDATPGIIGTVLSAGANYYAKSGWKTGS